MKNLSIIYLAVILILAGFASCDTEDELRKDILRDTEPVTVTADPGTADFIKYVAVGTSISAGLMDAALYTSGQNNSFPNLLAAQFELAGGGDFVQPDINADRGFNILLNKVSDPTNAAFGRFILNVSIPAPEPLIPGDNLTPYSGPPVNNFGVPGARVVDLTVPQYGLESFGNYFYFRFASEPGVSTILGDALGAQGTFHTLEMGSNDVLGWVSAGGNGPDGDVTPGAESNPSALTGTALFGLAFNGVLSELTEGGGKVVVLNIPNILATPLLRAVTWDNIPLDQATADQLNVGFAGLNDALQGMVPGLISQEEADRRKVVYEASENNPILAIDDSMEDLGPKFDILKDLGAISAEERAGLEPFRQSRPLTEDDFVILFAGRFLGTEVGGDSTQVIGVSVPIDDDQIISKDEAEIASARLELFNDIIAAAVAADANAELVDANAKFTEIVTAFVTEGGYEINGLKLTPDFSPNGIFSVDSIHPNPRGHGIIANEIIKVINEKFGATIPEVDVTALPGVTIR